MGTTILSLNGTTSSTISSNVNGLLVFSGGQIVSHGGNILTNNTTAGALSSAVAQQ